MEEQRWREEAAAWRARAVEAEAAAAEARRRQAEATAEAEQGHQVAAALRAEVSGLREGMRAFGEEAKLGWHTTRAEQSAQAKETP